MPITSLADEAKIALDGFSDRLSALASPSLRLGVTGLSRAGKTVFIAAFVHNLIHGGRLPLFEAQKSGRISRAFLEPQPDDAVPRFDYESHVRELVESRLWPHSTRAVSELRLTINYESASGWNRLFSRGSLSVDIVDYPGEWLLDLPLLGKSYAQFSAEAFDLAELPLRSDLSAAMAGAVGAKRPAISCGRGQSPPACRKLHGLSARLPPGRTGAVRAAAGTLPDAGRPRRLARPHLRAASRLGSTRQSARARWPP